MNENKKSLIQEIITEDARFQNGTFLDTRIQHIHKDHNEPDVTSEGSIITTLKELLKRNDRIYYLIVNILSPTYFNVSLNKRRNALILKNRTTVNIWSGNKLFDPKVINIDLFWYNNVNIVSDATKLCIKDNSVDLVINEVNIEHIYDYRKVISESYRILKEGGISYYLIPFTEGFHASPYDYHRFTHKAIEILFKENGYSDIKVGVYAWPTSGFLWIFIEFLSTLLSFGIHRIYELWTIVFMILLWPIKYLDILLNHYESGKYIASVFYVIAKK